MTAEEVNKYSKKPIPHEYMKIKKRRIMREILFRAKGKIDGEWHYSSGVINVRDISFMFSERRPVNKVYDKTADGTDILFNFEIVDGETVGQFTGLTDKNGKKIFEGDIIKTFYCNLVIAYNIKESCYEGQYAGCPKIAKELKYCAQFVDNEKIDCEVIGNIHDNPELLKE